jgi:ubiquinone/menaquinone biosynthesis C-methylase UbiE
VISAFHRAWLAAAFLGGCAAPPAAPEASVAPGINDQWKSPDVEPLVERLETESREIWVHHEALAALAGPRPGSTVADIGAGSGFMSLAFARLVGPEGTVYAVDINPALLEHAARSARAAGLTNLRTVVCSERSVDLPDRSIDLAFICDTYHHFEYPASTMRSLHRAMRPGGQVVLVDFRREEGVSRPFILEHVRAGEAKFVAEIEAAGFELINDHDMPFLQENYVLRFRRR